MDYVRTWKVEGGYAEFEPATLDEIAEWLSDGFDVYLDEKLTKSARDLDFGWMTITAEYIEACEDDDVLFMPDLWDVVDSEEETTDGYWCPIPLTAEGRAFAKQWLSDASRGYDLRNGKCRGLAGRYSRYEMWDLICQNEEYHKDILD